MVDDIEAIQDLETLLVWIPPDSDWKAVEAESPQLERIRPHAMLIMGTIGSLFMDSKRELESLAQLEFAMQGSGLSRGFPKEFKPK